MCSTAHRMRVGIVWGSGMGISLPWWGPCSEHRHPPKAAAGRLGHVSDVSSPSAQNPQNSAQASAGAPMRVAVLGARGKVGQEICKAVEAAADLLLVAQI